MARLNKIDPKLIEEIKESVKKFTEFIKILPEYLVDLANLGWFITLDLSPKNADEICLKINEKDYNWIDSFMSKYISKKIDRIELKAIEKFPNRKKIIVAAFKAYKNKDYYLSIPALISQIDGICLEHFEGYFFSSNNATKKKIKDKIKQIDFNEMLNYFLSPIEEKISISSGKNAFQEFNPIVYNRHEIMHGINTTYGTKINCLKIISLFSYLMLMITKDEY